MRICLPMGWWVARGCGDNEEKSSDFPNQRSQDDEEGSGEEMRLFRGPNWGIKGGKRG